MKKELVLVCLLVFTSMAYAVSEQVVVSLVNQNPDPARAGETVELRFMVENRGGASVKDLEIELSLEYPFSEIPGERYIQPISTLSAYQQGADATIAKYRVAIDKDAVRGSHNVKAIARTAAGYVAWEYPIDVSGEEYAQILYVDKAKLDPGKETDLKFTIVNVGNSPLKNLVFSWNEADGVILPVYSDDTKYVKYLDVGQSIDLNYTVVADINAGAGLYQLDLNLKFEAEGATTSEMDTKAGVFVGGETDFEVTFSESSAGQTSLSVANTGNNPALSVTVKIPKQDAFTVSGSTSSIVGNLDKGDYTIVSFQIAQRMSREMDMGALQSLSPEERQARFSRTPPQGGASPPSPEGEGTITRPGPQEELAVVIEYTDSTGARRTVEKDVPIQFRDLASSAGTEFFTGFPRGGQQPTSNLWQWGLGLAVLVGGAVGYKERKVVQACLKTLKEKMKKRKEKKV